MLTRALASALAAAAVSLLPAAPASAGGPAGAVSNGGVSNGGVSNGGVSNGTVSNGTVSNGGASGFSAVADPVRLQQQWVLNMLDVKPAWSITQGANVTVAVIDTGVDPHATDLAGSVITRSYDFTGLNTSPRNQHWGKHGTWMASIIAGHGHNGGADGIIGIAPEAKILSIRVIPDRHDPGYATYDSEPEQQIQKELADGIREAVRWHAQVISMSIGYSAPSGVVRAALQYAYAHGTVLVASSGNSGDTNEPRAHGWAPVSFPAEYPGVLSVGAVDSSRQPAPFSSGNLSVKVAAPGAGVPAQGRNNLYYTVDGTSPACALVAGVAALIKSKYRGIPPDLVTEALTSTAQSPGGYNVKTGFGIVDAYKALVKAGKLMRGRPAGSQVPLAGYFGGGAAAVPAAPVAPRGAGPVVVSVLLALVSLGVAAGGLALIRRSRGRRPRPAPQGQPGTAPR